MPKVHETAYNSLLRPQLEYASARIRTRRCEYPKSNKSREELQSLEQRRADARLCLFYKVIHGLVTVPLPYYIHYSNRISRYCHSMTFRQVLTSTDYYKISFFPLAIVQWNSLPESVACLQSLDAFKAPVCNLQHSHP